MVRLKVPTKGGFYGSGVIELLLMVLPLLLSVIGWASCNEANYEAFSHPIYGMMTFGLIVVASAYVPLGMLLYLGVKTGFLQAKEEEA